MTNLLKLKNFNIDYVNKDKTVHAVKNINLSINKGDSLGIVGESGSGKSTLAMGLLRLLPEKSSNTSGEVLFQEEDLMKYDKKQLQSVRWKDISVVFQKAMNSLSPVHRIGVQVEDIYKVHNKNLSNNQIQERFNKILIMVGLNERVYKLYPHELSGGMLQRVCIAISLINNPKLLIMDEATTALDVVTQGQILEEITRMEKDMNMTRIMITHDMSVVAMSCNKVAVMYAGELMEVGYVKNVLKNPKHPYTKGLLSSFPSLKGEKEELKGIKGSLPDLSKEYSGCIFASRCSSAKEICFKKEAEEIYINEEEMVKCHLLKEVE